ncbi:MAG: C-GCAxxG-C-C family protein [Lawsonibacter sp.]|nr:C-GCAxxG-C-C family protein [Lawsonibacter sp.]
MDRIEHTRALRGDTNVHYNCCQSVLVTFAEEMGLSEAQSYALGSHFAGGMNHGATCGVLTGALMVLGSLGYDKQQALALLQQFREKHGSTDCAVLLKASHDRGEARTAHCDGLVYEMVEALEAQMPHE